MVSQLRKPILDCCFHLLWFYIITDFELSCFAMLAKPYPVSCPAYLPQIPSQHHGMSKGGHEMLGTILLARLLSVFNRK